MRPLAIAAFAAVAAIAAAPAVPAGTAGSARAQQVSLDVVGEWLVTPAYRPGDGTMIPASLGSFVASHRLVVRDDGAFTFGPLRGALAEIPAGLRSDRYRHYAGLVIDGVRYVITAVPPNTSIAISREMGSTLTLLEGKRIRPTGTERPNPLGVEWAGAGSQAPANPSPTAPAGAPPASPPPAVPSGGGLGIEWRTSASPAPAPLPTQPASPTSPAPQPQPPATGGGLGVEWRTASGTTSAPQPTPPTRPTQPTNPTPPPQPPTTGGGLGVEWRTNTTPVAPPAPVTPTPPNPTPTNPTPTNPPPTTPDPIESDPQYSVWGIGCNAASQLGGALEPTGYPAPIRASTSAAKPRSAPIRSVPFRDVTALAAGGEYSLALRADGSLWGWGSNAHGALASLAPAGRTDAAGRVGQARRIAGLPPLRAISAGWKHALAVATDGSVWSWGTNDEGQLGRGAISRTPDATPQRVTGLPAIVAVAAGSEHSVALAADGTVWAWGRNMEGQVGRAADPRNTAVPRQVLAWNPGISETQVFPLTDIVGVSAGSRHSVALARNGLVWAWGWNRMAQLGRGHTQQNVNNALAQPVRDLARIVQVAAGGDHNIALSAERRVHFWGNRVDKFPQGTWDTDGLVLSPIREQQVENVAGIAAGGTLSFIQYGDGTVGVWAPKADRDWEQRMGTARGNGVYSALPWLSDVYLIATSGLHTLILGKASP